MLTRVVRDRWTKGKAVFAAGSPFSPVTLEDGVTRYPSQCNNMFLFPGVGLAASVAKIERITDNMLYQASIAVANAVQAEDRFPSSASEGPTSGLSVAGLRLGGWGISDQG